jgi:hypothetical protein
MKLLSAPKTHLSHWPLGVFFPDNGHRHFVKPKPSRGVLNYGSLDNHGLGFLSACLYRGLAYTVA